MRIRILVLLATMLPICSLAAEKLQKKFTDDELIDQLGANGFRAVEQVEDRVLQIKIDGHTYVLYIYEDDDLQLYFGLTGYAVTESHMNEWNRSMRLSRAYLDDENDPILEADLLANAGYTTEQLVEWLNVFDSTAREYRRFIADNDESE